VNWITENILKSLADAVSGFLDMYGELIGNIFDKVADANVNSGPVVNASNFMLIFSLALLGLLAAKQILDVYVFQTSGDPDAEPLELAVRIAQACAVVCSSAWIFDEFLKFSRYFTNDFLQSVQDTGNVSQHMNGLIEEAVATMDTLQSQAVGMILTLVLVFVGFFIFCIVAGLRGAELTLMKIIMPLFAMDLLTTNRERWNSFFTTYLITFFAYSLQLFEFKMCSMTFMSIEYAGNYSMKFLIVIGWLVLMIRTPHWIEKFAYSSGIARAASGGLRAIPFMIRR